MNTTNNVHCERIESVDICLHMDVDTARMLAGYLRAQWMGIDDSDIYTWIPVVISALEKYVYSTPTPM